MLTFLKYSPKIAILILAAFFSIFSAKAQLVFDKDQYQIDENLHLILCNRIPAPASGLITSISLDKLYEFYLPVSSIQTGVAYEVSYQNNFYKLYFTRLPIINLSVKDSISDDYAGGLINIADTINASTTINMGVKIRGSYSRTFPKKSYHIQLWADSTGATTTSESFFGMRNDQTWLLLAIYNEKLRLNNKLSQELWLKMDTLYYANLEPDAHSSIRSKYVEVFLNGSYQGVYLFAEDMDRKQLQLKKQTVSNPGGELYKGETWDNGTLFRGLDAFPVASTEDWGGWEVNYPDTTNWINLYQFTDFAVNSPDSTFKQQISTKIRPDNFADYFIFLNILRAEDNQGKNLFLARYGKNEPYFIAPWDLDGTWGYYWDGSRKDVTNDILSNGLFNRLLNTPSFKSQLITRWFSLRKTILSADILLKSITTDYDFLTENGVYERENMKWAGDLLSYGTDELAYIQNWTKNRLAWLDTYFKSINSDPTIYSLSDSLSGSTVVLNWSANCSAIYSFDVERSLDGLTWTTISPAPISSNDSTTCQYTFTDINPISGLSYYRLKVTDTEAGILYSFVIPMNIELPSTAVIVFPNPASTTVQVRGNVEKINLYSSLGMALYESTSSTPNAVDVKSLPTGMYLLRVTQKNGSISTHKILVNRD